MPDEQLTCDECGGVVAYTGFIHPTTQPGYIHICLSCEKKYVLKEPHGPTDPKFAPDRRSGDS